MNAVARPRSQSVWCPAMSCAWFVASRISSFEKKPESGGTPAIASTPTRNVNQVTGMRVRSPPIFVMSCSWCMPRITEPAPRNSSALKNAWVIT